MLIDDAKATLHLDGVEDTETLNRLTMLLEHGQAYLTGLTGTPLDFEQDREAHALLMGYVRYAYNDATELFLENFYDDVFRMQLKEAMKERANNATQRETESGSTDTSQSTN